MESSSSEEEGEISPQSITHYSCVDDANFWVSFAALPFYWDGMERVERGVGGERVFLRGTADGGEKIYKVVCYWKFELLGDCTRVLVMAKGGKWIELLKPRKAYEPCIRTVMIAVEWLRFLRREPDASRKRAWEHLELVFRASDVRPSENDLRDHVTLIRSLFQRDTTLCTSQVLMEFLKETPVKGMDSDEVVQNVPDLRLPSTFNDVEMDEGEEGDDFEESTLFDTVCALCDNGGEILCCEGQCLRSFHATKGADSRCTSFCYSRAQVKAIHKFFCNNCLYKQHQCFACGKLGSSDRTAGPEVFRCVSATCGHFYHPKCAAKQLFLVNEARTEHEQKIAFGEPFTCPLHKCFHCKQGENKKIRDLQFAICRRCPKSYHRKCLPGQITFENLENGPIQRAWDGLLPNRILMYCLDHRMDETLGTPRRNHIIFPEVPVKKKLVVDCKSKERTILKQNMVSDHLRVASNSIKPRGISEKGSSFVGKSGESFVQKIHDVSRKGKSMKMASKLQQDQFLVKEKTKSSIPTCRAAYSGKKFITAFPAIDAETEMRMACLLEEASTSVSFEDVTRKCTIPSTHNNYTTRLIDKNITMGKVEGSVQAIQTALTSLQNGSSIEDATAICEPEVLRQISKWRSKLNVYLSPFLLGTRYTSFGRHFTKVDKLEEIVDRLQWYIRNGDTIVDFCCGANDFSTLLKGKLDDGGKKCAFKNYDIIYPKNEFSFEKRDWMTVQTSELPNGSELIMGLNPPFGVKASLANKFVNKALSFMPKLLILIVPEETVRPDKDGSYDLIWADVKKLSGKSFYLPGSVDVKDAKLEQWNLRPPPLYLWSRRDWTMKHREIAMRQGHLSIEHADSAKETQRGLSFDLNSVEANSSSVWSGNKRRYDKPYENKSPQAEREGELSDMSISPPSSSARNYEGQYPPAGIILSQRAGNSGPFGFQPQIGQCPETGTVCNEDPAVVASGYQTHSRTENCRTIQGGNVDQGIHSSEGHP